MVTYNFDTYQDFYIIEITLEIMHIGIMTIIGFIHVTLEVCF